MNRNTILHLLIGASVLSQIITIANPSPLRNTHVDKSQNVKSKRIRHELFETEITNKELVQRAVSTVATSLFDKHLFQQENMNNSDGENSSVRNLERSQRRLGDFDAFNALFQGTTIILPDALNLPAGSYLWYDVYLDLTQIRCRDLAVDNIVISHNAISNQRLDLRIELFGIKLSCNLNIGFRLEGFAGSSGGGTGSAETENSRADAIIEFISDGFDYHPPKESNLGPTSAFVQLGDFSLGGSNVFFNIANLFKSTFKSRVESEISTVLKEELGSLGADALEDLLVLLNAKIEDYLQPLPPELTNPLHAENNLEESDGIKLVNFQKPDDNSLTKWLVESVDKISDFLGGLQSDSSSPTGTGEDLGVNVLMRSLLLNDNREYIIPFADWPFGDNNGLIFMVHDRMTKTSIELTNAKIIGLDTMTHIDPLNILGKHTITNHFSWKELILEVDIELRIEASTLPDSIFESGNDQELVENIKVKIGLDDLEVDFHFLLALDDAKWSNLHLSQVLNTNKIIACLLDTVHKAEITGLSVSTTNIHTPTLEGFISNGIDRVIKSIADATFVMYEAVLIRVMPNFFQKEVRQILNNATDDITQGQTTNECVPYTQTGELKAVDFRDLLLDPDEAKARGAVGDSRYGDVAQTILNLIQDELLANDPESQVESPLVNRVVIRPFTKSQSGVEGMLRFNDTLISISEDNINDPIGSAIASSFGFDVHDFRLSNLDTLHNPIKVLDPQNKPTTLYNTAHLGDSDAHGYRKLQNVFDGSQSSLKYLKGSTRILLEVEGNGSPFEMRNDVDLSIVIPHIEALAAFYVFVVEDDFMSMKLENILNLNCWLAMIPAPELDGEGFPIDNSTEPTVKLSQLLMDLSDLQIFMDCVSCSTTGLTEVSEVFQMIHASGAMSELRTRLVTFADNVIRGPWLHTQISRELYHAPKQCPGHPAYIENYEAPSYNAVPFPALSDESMEMVILSGAILSEVSLVVIAESHSNIEANTSDPLSVQNDFETPPNITLIDLTNVNSTFGGLADMAISELRSVVNSSIEDATGPKAPEKDLWVNVQLRSLLLDENRSLAIDVDGLSFSFGGATIELNQVRLSGLDTFKSVNILDIIAPQTILNSFLLERITIEVDMIIDTIDDIKGPEVMTLKAGLKDMNVSLGMFLAIDEDALGDLELGSLLHMKNILPCLLSSLHRFEITQLAVSVSDIEVPTFDGYISARIKEVISSSMDMIFEEYKSVMISSMPAVFDVTIRQFINALVLNFIESADSICPSVTLTSRSFINFGDLLLSEKDSMSVNGLGTSPYGDVMRMLMNVVEETVLKIDPVDGTSAINEKLIRGLTNAQSNVPGTLILAGDVFGTRTQLDIGGLKGVLEFKASNARIENLDTVGQPLKLLDPIEPFVLNNTATVGVGSRELRAAVSLVIAFEDENHYLRNEFDMSLDIKSAQVVLAALIKMSEKLLLRFPMRDIFNIHCWLSTIPAPILDTKGVRLPNSDLNAALQNIAVVISQIRLHINCTECSSPGMHMFASHLSSPDAVKSVTSVANDLFGYVTSLLGGEFLQIQIDRFLSEAPAQCPHNLAYDSSASAVVYQPFSTPEKTNDPLGFLFVILGVCLSLICIISLLIISVRRIRQRRHERWIQTLSKEEIVEINEQQMMEKKREDKLNRTTTRMISSSTIPAFVRYSMPVVIFGNIAFFLSGHLNLGASVNIRANIAGDTINIDKFFEFSMARSTLDMWNAGAKALAILIGIFSGAWPYTKQFITLFLWIAPPKLVSVPRRESIFIWLDRLAKWSIVDIFVLLMSVAAFNISVNSPENVAFLPPNLYSLKLLVVPLWGMYANMTAQLLSQISSHIIIHYHRKIVAEALGEAYGGGRLGINNRDESMAIDDEVIDNTTTSNPMAGSENQGYIGALCNHRFDRDGIKKDISLYVCGWVNYVMIFLAITFIILLICGCSISSFSLEVVGIIGLVVESGQDFQQAITQYSVFNIVDLLSSQSKELGTAADSTGLGTLSFLLILSVLIVPILQVVLLLGRWFRRLTRKSQTRIFVTLEILDSWQYIEVYILSVAVAAWQLGGVSEFMINSFCGSLEDTFASLAYYGIISDEDAQCFRVNPRVQSGLWLLLASALVLAFMNHFVSKAASQQERDINVKTEEHETDLSESQERDLYSPSDECSVSENEFVDDVMGVSSKHTIKPASVYFTDTYRWFLYKKATPIDDSFEVGMGVPFNDDDKSVYSISNTVEISFSSDRSI